LPQKCEKCEKRAGWLPFSRSISHRHRRRRERGAAFACFPSLFFSWTDGERLGIDNSDDKLKRKRERERGSRRMSLLRQHRPRQCSAALHPSAGGMLLSSPKVKHPVDGDVRGVARTTLRRVKNRRGEGENVSGDYVAADKRYLRYLRIADNQSSMRSSSRYSIKRLPRLHTLLA